MSLMTESAENTRTRASTAPRSGRAACAISIQRSMNAWCERVIQVCSSAGSWVDSFW